MFDFPQPLYLCVFYCNVLELNNKRHCHHWAIKKKNSHARTQLDNQQFACKHMTGQALTIHT